jgi:hypothetical protein
MRVTIGLLAQRVRPHRARRSARSHCLTRAVECLARIIHNGIFMHKLSTTPASFEIGRSDDIPVVVDKTRYAFFCDSLPILAVSHRNPASQTGGMAIILWDNSGDSKIDAAVSNLRVAL